MEVKGERKISQCGSMRALLSGMISFRCKKFMLSFSLLTSMTSSPSEPSTNVRLAVCASFEMSPMLGKGEVLYVLERSVAEWTENTHCKYHDFGGPFGT